MPDETLLPEFSTTSGASNSLLCAAFLILLAVALGRRTLILLGAPRGANAGERVVLAACLGFGGLPLIVIALGATGLLRPTSLRVALAVASCALSWDLYRILASAHQLHRLRRTPRWLMLLTAVTLPAWGVRLLLALAPTVDPDGLIYHLTVPKRWLEAGSLQYLPTYPYSNTPMGVESLFAIALVTGGDSVAKCLSLGAGLIAAAGVFLAGRRLGGLAGAAASWILVLLVLVPGLGTAYIEGPIAMAMCGALLAWTLWILERDRSWLWCAALLGGVCVSFKISAADFTATLIGLSVAVVAIDPAVRLTLAGSPAQLAAAAAKVLALVVLPVAPWMIRAGLQTGNPFFPLATRLLPTRDLSPQSAERFALAMRYLSWGQHLSGWSVERRRQLLLGAALSLCLVILFGALPRLRSGLGRAVALAVLAVCLIRLSAVGLYLRLWVPLLVALIIPLMAMVGRSLSDAPVRAALIVLGAIASTAQVRDVMETPGSGELIKAVMDPARRRDYLVDNLAPFPLYEWINHQLPKNANILLSGYSGGFYIDRTTFATDFVQDSLRFTTWDSFLADADRLHVTHIIAPVAATPGSSLVDRKMEFDVVHRLIRERGRLLARAADLELYAIAADATDLR